MNGYRRWFKKQFGIDLDGSGVAKPSSTTSKVTHTTPSPEVTAIRGKVFDAGGLFKNNRLEALYKIYADAKKQTLKKGEKELTKDEWILAARGEAREILDKELGKDWTTHFKKAKQWYGRMHGEISVELSEDLLNRLKPYPVEQVGDAPFDVGQRVELGPSIDRIDTDVWRKEFLEDLYSGNITHLDPNVLAQFEEALRNPNVGVTVKEIGVRPDGKGKYYWPLDDVQKPWELHHIWPLEWNGKDVLTNLMPLRYRDHSALHEWWTDLKDYVLSDWEARLARKTAVQVEVK